MIEKKNYSGNPDPDVGGETSFKNCNFSHPAPVKVDGEWVGVRLFPGDNTPRHFESCNMKNCEVPPGSTEVDCNTTIAHSGVTVRTDEIVIDGDTIAIDIKGRAIHGRRTGVGEYAYYPSPIIIENEEVD